MAVTITQQPTSPNAAYTRLPYVVSGSVTTSNPQYQYVMDIYESGSSDLITRIVQTKNPAGVAVFDPSRVFQGELSEDQNWKIVGISGSINSNKTFTLKFGEQYGTSISSSVTVYPDLDTVDISVFPATHDLNLQDNPFLTGSALDVDQSGWNFPILNFQPTSSPAGFLDCLLTNNPYFQDFERDTITPQKALLSSSVASAAIVGKDDYYTISRLIGSGSVPQKDPDLRIEIYSGSTQVGQGVLSGSLPDSSVFNFGVGPSNILNTTFDTVFIDNPSGVIESGSWTHYEATTTVWNSLAGGQVNTVYFVNEQADFSSIPSSIVLPDPVDVCDDKVRFAWINNFGQWDYYNVYNPVRRQSDIERQSVTLPQIDYSSISSPYEVNRRGQKDYYIDRKDRFEVTTDYLMKPSAQWLEELFDSPSVYIQKGASFIPVIITNTQYQHNNSTSRNKLFQYTIEFEPANQPYGDWDQIPS